MREISVKITPTTVALVAAVVFAYWYFTRPNPAATQQATVVQKYDSARVVNLTVNLNTPGTKIEFPKAEAPAPALDSATLARIVFEIVSGAQVKDSSTVRDSSIDATILTTIERNRLKNVELKYRWLKPVSTQITLPPVVSKFKLHGGAFLYLPEAGRVAFGPSITPEFPEKNFSFIIGRDLNSKSWLLGFQKTFILKRK